MCKDENYFKFVSTYHLKNVNITCWSIIYLQMNLLFLITFIIIHWGTFEGTHAV